MPSDLVDRLRGVKSSQAIKVPCRVATTANITLSGLQTIDGVTLVEDDRVLVKDQTTGSENGIYDVSTGPWSRAPDWDGRGDVVKGTTVYVTDGTTRAGRWVVTTSNPITIGTTSVAFAGSSAADGFLQDGAGAVTRTVQSKLRDFVSVKDFGAVGDDTADDSAAFQAALDALPSGGILKLRPGKTYRLADGLTVTDKAFHIDARGARIHIDADVVVLNAVNGVTALQDVSGITETTISPPDSSVYAVRTVIEVEDGSAFARGDLVKIISDDVYEFAEDDDTTLKRRVGEMAHVVDVDGNDIYIMGLLNDRGRFSTNIRIFKPNPNTLTIRGGKWYYTDGQTGWDNALFQIYGYVNPVIEVESVPRVYGAAIKPAGTYNCLITGGSVGALDNNPSSGLFGYGVFDSGVGTTIFGLTGSDCRHVTDAGMGEVAADSTEPVYLHQYGAVRGGSVTACKAFGPSGSAFTTHGGVDGYSIRDVYGERCNLVVGVRGWGVSVSGVKGRSCANGVHVLTQLDRIPTEAGYTRGARISDLDIKCTGDVFLVTGGLDVSLHGYIDGETTQHRAIRVQNGQVECYADIVLRINGAEAGSTDTSGIIRTDESAVSYQSYFKQRTGRIVLDATRDTGGSNKRAIYASQTSRQDFRNLELILSAAYDFAFVTTQTAAVDAQVKLAVDDAADNAVALSSGSNIRLSAESGDATNDAQDLENVQNWRVGRRLRLPNAGLRLRDTNDTHDLIVSPGSNLSADRTLTITTGDADRTLDISAGSTVLAHGTYTPTLSNTTNVASSTAYVCQWMRVGNVVTVSGRVDVTPTAGSSTTTSLGISLPVASDLANVHECAGTAYAFNIENVGSAIIGSTSANRAVMGWEATSTTAHQMFFTFTYQII